MADLSSADINDLPDSAFAFIEPGGTKDAGGKTTPRSKRHFPVQDEAHARNALDRMGSSPFGGQAKPAILAACKKFGIDVSGHESKAAGVPHELRRRRGSMFGRPERRRAPARFELRAMPDGTGGSMYELNFYASTFNDLFGMWDQWGEPYEEVVRPGAFTQTLGRPDLDTSLLLGHNEAGLPYARTSNGKVRMAQDTQGLHVNAQRLNAARSDVRDMVIAVQDGDLSEASIGFVTMPGGQKWSQDWQVREMLNLDLHRGDVSLVTYGANPATKGATALAMPGEAAWSASWQPSVERRTPTEPYSAHKGEDNECPVCHSVNDDAAKHCDQCGHAMQPKSPVSNMHGVENMNQQCSSCKKWNSADAKFCGQCGRNMSGNMGPSGAYSYDDWSASRPGAQGRAQSEITDLSTHADFNVADNGVSSVKCPYTRKNGCGKMCPGDSTFCNGCGGPLYDSDGTIVLDDSGVTEETGAAGDAELLSRRLRLLELA